MVVSVIDILLNVQRVDTSLSLSRRLCVEGKVRFNCQKVDLMNEVEVKEGDIFDVWLSEDKTKRWIFLRGEWKCFTT